MKFKDLSEELERMYVAKAKIYENAEIAHLNRRLQELEIHSQRTYVLRRVIYGTSVRESIVLTHLSSLHDSSGRTIYLHAGYAAPGRNYPETSSELGFIMTVTVPELERLIEIRRTCNRWLAGEIDELPQHMPWEADLVTEVV